MTITRAQIGTPMASTANQSAYGSADGAPTGALSANALVLAYVIVSDTGGSDPLTAGHEPVPNNTPWGLTFTEQTAARISRDFDGAGNIRAMFLYSATVGAGGAASDSFDITENGANDAYTGAIIYAVQYTDSSGRVPVLAQVKTDIQTAGAQPSFATFDALAKPSWVECAWCLDRTAPAGTPDGGWTEGYDNGYNNPATGLFLVHSNGLTSDNTPSGSWVNSDFIAVGTVIEEPPLGRIGTDYHLRRRRRVVMG